MDDGRGFEAWLASLPAAGGEAPVDDVTHPDRMSLLAGIIDYYLESGDFNGLAVVPSSDSHEGARTLIADGLVQLVTGTDYLNTHIRPWVRSDWERQLDEFDQVVRGDTGGCLYPTAAGMATRAALPMAPGKPFLERLLRAESGTLDLAFFEMAAIEGYLNDPAFQFRLGDDGFSFADVPALTDDLDFDDLTLLKEAGYAYDHSVDPKGEEPIKRYWAALMCDLAGLPSQHQQRIKTYQLVNPAPRIEPHPIWWGRMMGHWPESIGPFTKVLFEMKALNEVWSLAFGTELFRSTDRPPTWGWVLRSTSRDWEGFILTTSTLLVDGLSAKGLDAAGAPKQNDAGDVVGTLNRLGLLLDARTSPSTTSEGIRRLLAPLHEVRKERQAPAHKTNENVHDPLILNRQRDLLMRLTETLIQLREFVSTHSAVRRAGWKPDPKLERWVVL